jgi:hypothetical protein
VFSCVTSVGVVAWREKPFDQKNPMAIPTMIYKKILNMEDV